MTSKKFYPATYTYAFYGGYEAGEKHYFHFYEAMCRVSGLINEI